MFNLRQVVFAIGATSIFLVLIVFSVLSYNRSEAENIAYRSAINEKTLVFLDTSLNFFNKIVPERNKDNDDIDLSKSSWSDNIKGIISINRKEEGLSITIRNSRGEYVESVLPIFKKHSK